MHGELLVILAEWCGLSSDAICRVYPDRDVMPSKGNLFIDCLNELNGLGPYWAREFDLKTATKGFSRKPTIASNSEKSNSGG